MDLCWQGHNAEWTLDIAKRRESGDKQHRGNATKATLAARSASYKPIIDEQEVN